MNGLIWIFGVAYFYMGVSVLYLIEGLTGYLFLHEPFPLISFCLTLIVFALCIVGQLAGWLEPFAYNKILFLLMLFWARVCG